ncbi:hypothetical protein [Rhizobium sp. NXC24]|uniref:hypothetical protein n=1 Tax=Rhizobium sp. NXC24 TaxID=2048897 RepID=UPI000CF2DE98|nr:hypothetical protein [Rhizobium sp. NXC24]
MVKQSAEIHTLAPRLAYLEALGKWPVENRVSGGGVDHRLWRAALETVVYMTARGRKELMKLQTCMQIAGCN